MTEVQLIKEFAEELDRLQFGEIWDDLGDSKTRKTFLKVLDQCIPPFDFNQDQDLISRFTENLIALEHSYSLGFFVGYLDQNQSWNFDQYTALAKSAYALGFDVYHTLLGYWGDPDYLIAKSGRPLQSILRAELDDDYSTTDFAKCNWSPKDLYQDLV